MIRQEFGLIMVRDLGDRHRGRAGENMRKLALAIRRQVQDDDVGETKVGRQRAEKVLERFDASGGGADAAHGNESRVVHA